MFCAVSRAAGNPGNAPLSPLPLPLSLVHTLSILMWGTSLSSTSSERVYCARTELCLFCFLFFFFLSPFYDFTSLRERAEEKEEGEGEREPKKILVTVKLFCYWKSRSAARVDISDDI